VHRDRQPVVVTDTWPKPSIQTMSCELAASLEYWLAEARRLKNNCNQNAAELPRTVRGCYAKHTRHQPRGDMLRSPWCTRVRRFRSQSDWLE
jgi:hypothetical protein